MKRSSEVSALVALCPRKSGFSSVAGVPTCRYRWLLSAAAFVLSTACGDSGNGPTGGGSGGGNLRIETLYLVQSTQTREGAVPLLAGKDAYLRVFVVASSTNSMAPAVRVRLYLGGVLQQTLMIPAAGSSVPTSVDQSRLTNSWNVKIPAATIQPGLQILADVDPGNSESESNEQDNSFPVSGSPLNLPITALQPFRIRFVPMVQEENGRTGRVSATNLQDYLTLTRKIHPVTTIDADVRAPYTVRGLGFDPQGNTWQAAVAELNAVRVAEGSDRFYYGVVNTDYNGGGVVGIAAGIPAGAALGWDRFPDAPTTVAHEIGHDWGRRHAPCGGAGGPDPSYPYPLGMIGAYGLDIETLELKVPAANTDIMGYCDARFWISDYTFTEIFRYRAANPSTSIVPAGPALLVWGSIENGVPKLQPAFQVNAPRVLPAQEGPYLIEGLDRTGRSVFSHRFASSAIPDIADDVRPFAFALPMSAEDASQIVTIRLRTRDRESRQVARTIGDASLQSGVPSRSAMISRTGANRVSVRWNETACPLVVIRDANTGAILSLARGGDVSVATNGGDVQLVFSDGVRSVATGCD